MKKGVLKSFAKVTGRYLCQSLFFDKVAGLRSEKETLAHLFTEHLQTTASVFPVSNICFLLKFISSYVHKTWDINFMSYCSYLKH